MVVEISVFNTNGSGTIRMGKAGATPSATVVQWARTGDKATSSSTTAVSGGRSIAIESVSSTGATDFTIDVVGYYR